MPWNRTLVMVHPVMVFWLEASSSMPSPGTR